MSKINIEFKDRIVEFPNRYSLTDNGDGTYTLTPFPGEITEEGTPVNAGNLNEIVSKHNALYDYINNPARGHQAFSGTLSENEVIELTIPIKQGAKRGTAIVNSGRSGVMVLFDTNPDWGFVTGNAATGLDYERDRGSAWSVRDKGFVTNGYDFGMGAVGAARLRIEALYIDGNNLKIVIKNNYHESLSYNFVIDYEVR